MNRVVLPLLAVAFCFAVGQALQCYKCDIGLWKFCLTTKVTCDANELCYTGSGKAAGFLPIVRKGCLATDQCNKTEEVHFPSNSTTVYTMNKMCCSGDLCNAAPGLVGIPGLSLALATVTALFVANILV
uniref:UPAR/Ly6 domain-containing protein n=1 Tax=Monopterus albus TaxID=43700 RepID=A0A3Q3QKC3_MONAL|nr:sperm acrosome membrane-associated protein 4-like [Monopterus albus]